MQVAIINDEAIDADQLIRITGTARRLLAGITGRARKQPADGPSVDDLFADDAEAGAE
jgi:hypothetical protein